MLDFVEQNVEQNFVEHHVEQKIFNSPRQKFGIVLICLKSPCDPELLTFGPTFSLIQSNSEIMYVN